MLVVFKDASHSIFTDRMGTGGIALNPQPGNLSMMEWAELDLDSALWVIPSMKTKRTKQEEEQGDAHTVPLPVPVPVRAVALLRSLHPLTGHGRYVFSGERSLDRSISDNSVLSALYALGFGKEHT